MLGLVLAAAGVAVATPVEKSLRPVRLLQDLPELGLSAGVRMEADGALAVSATAGELTVRKQVYADGRFVVRVATQGDDRLLISGTANGLKVTYGREAALELRADRDSDYDGKARSVRGWLARSDAVQRFRQIAEALEQQDAMSPEALSLRVTGALVAELLGDPGAAQRAEPIDHCETGSPAPQGAGRAHADMLEHLRAARRSGRQCVAKLPQ